MFSYFRVLPESLNEDVVNCPSNSVHQDRDLGIDENAGEHLRGELRSLVGVEYFRSQIERQGFVGSRYAKINRDGVGSSPGENLARIPVHDR